MSQNRLINVSELVTFADGIRDAEVKNHFLAAVDASRSGRFCLKEDLKVRLNGSRDLLQRFLLWQVMPLATTFADDREWMAGVDSALAS